MSASVVSVATAIGVTAIAYRHVSDATLGTYFTVLAGQALLTLLEPVVAFAVSRTTARSMAAGEDRSHAVAEMRRTLDGLAVTAIVALGATSVGVLLWQAVASPASGLPLAVWLLAVVLAVQLLTAILPAAATGSGNFRAGAVATIVGAATNVALALLLVPRTGVEGLAWALLAGVVAGRGLMLAWRSRHAPWVPLRPVDLTLAGAVALWRDSGTLLLTAAAGQLVTWSDLVVLSAFRDSATTAQYRLGVLVPTQAVALLFRAYDVVYPYLASGDPAAQVRATRMLTRAFGALGGAALGGLIAVHLDVLTLLGGGDAQRNASVPFVLFALMWAANVPAHGLALLLIAREQQRVLLPVVLVEAGANIALTLLLTPVYGAAGAATASLVTLAVCNLVALPVLVRRSDMQALRLVLLEGLAPVTTMLLLSSGLLALVIRAADGEVARSCIATSGALVLGVAGAAVCGGADGRRALRRSLMA